MIHNGGSLPSENGERTDPAGKKANTAFNRNSDDVGSNYSNYALQPAFVAIELFSGVQRGLHIFFIMGFMCEFYVVKKASLRH